MIRLAGVAAIAVALAHAGDNPLAEFMRSLHTPDGRPCCSMDGGGGDCFEIGETNYWPNPAEPGGYMANHQGVLVRVPRDAVQPPRADNPFEGAAVLCLYWLDHGPVVRCFVPPVMTN